VERFGWTFTSFQDSGWWKSDENIVYSAYEASNVYDAKISHIPDEKLTQEFKEIIER